MKSNKFLLLAVFILSASSVFAQDKTNTIKVYGECGMCKTRIQKTLQIEGISTAVWSPETRLLVVTYNAEKITNDDIQKRWRL